MNADHDIPELREVGDAYSRLARTEQPPAELDRAVRTAASAHAARAKLWRARARTRGAAMAATLVVAVVAVIGTSREPQPYADSASVRAGDADQPRAAQPLAGGDSASASAKVGFDAAPPGDDASGDECAAVAATPDPWLACIATLARAGRSAAAARELDAFRARFPDYAPLPDLDALAPR